MKTEREVPQEKQKAKRGKVSEVTFSVLDGSFLNKGAAAKHLPFALLLFFLGFTYIYISHSSERKTRQLNKLSKQYDEYYSEYISLELELSEIKSQSGIAKKLEPYELRESKERPKKLVKK